MEIFLRNINDNPNWNRFYNTSANCVLGDTVQRFYEGFLFVLSRYHISPQGKYGFFQPIFKKVINVQRQYTRTSHNQFQANRTIIGHVG